MAAVAAGFFFPSSLLVGVVDFVCFFLGREGAAFLAGVVDFRFLDGSTVDFVVGVLLLRCFFFVDDNIGLFSTVA